ncbi:ABC transporter permease [Acetatifactor aquisgranensis]|uniref:ABC transporter permease n=1 Tax=Acetatifactor aquisgranensis TaxID=2941233 RepID=UPI00203D6E0C|nr:ABC transporter permease [Acetatifactor aquisgranensis]MCI8541873.1 ABC transporter permease [Lachnospiraceae bacterium]
MKRSFYLKLASDNMRKNGKTYTPYLVTCILTVAIYYIVKSLSLNPGLGNMVGSTYLNETMFLGSCVIGIFAFIFLFYTNSFLMKRRKKEFGVFNILGMEKKHISRVLAWESVYTALISLVLGLGLGIALDKAMYLVINKVLGGESPFGFFLSFEAIRGTFALFAVIFLLICLRAVRQIHITDPIALLRAGNVGEKEPRTKWFLALAGVLVLAGGYYIALTVKNPIASLVLFFVAVILVIVGTYLLFTAGSIALLKSLRKNKRYYYRTKHFVSVSGMIYRMKQNAVGLANICILSTMVLVMVSSTTSLMVGMEGAIGQRYPADVMVYFSPGGPEGNPEGVEAVRTLRRELGAQGERETVYRYLAFPTLRDDDEFVVSKAYALDVLDDINNLFLITLEDYNASMGEQRTLEDGEIFLYSNRGDFDSPTLRLMDREYRVKGRLDSFVGNGIVAANIASTYFIVVPDVDALQEIYEEQKAILEQYAGEIRQVYGFDMEAEREEQNAFCNALRERLSQSQISASVEGKAEARTSFLGVYGGFFFIGIFLGTLFVIATVLIIYYKQISEGYDDKNRFEVMQKVGMSRDEVKASIHSQVLTVFFLPLMVAGIHVAAAFPMISRLLELFNMLDTRLYVACTAICFLVFAGMYVMIYGLTAKTYYRIVSR